MARGVHRRGTGPAVRRSAITNGSRLFMIAPSSASWARRMKDLLEAYVGHLGGPDAVTAPQHAVCRRISVLVTEMEILEHRFAKSGKGAKERDLDLYVRAAGCLRRLLECIGLRQEARDITPNIIDYEAADARIDQAIERMAAERAAERRATA
jgi:hypothetical protein